MRYLLDANAVIAVLNEPDGSVGTRLRAQDPGDVGLSAIAAHELYYSAYRSRRREYNLGLVDGLLFEVVQFDREDGRHAGEIRAALASAGTPIGPYDALIAGQARARELTLVTANVEEYRRVAGLVLEDWSRA
jgi:tRNA(fMet)-specific endonuclease VapC